MWFLIIASLLTLSNSISTYDENISNIAVNLSQASYCVSNTWDCATCDNSNILESTVESHGERVLLGYNKNLNSMFVSFRGSTNIQNWIDNIQFSKVYPYNDTNIGVEKGFYKAYNNVKPDILEALNKIQNKYSTTNILLTGHSLGGALATLMAFDIKDKYDLIFYSFGSPRVGNEYFVNYFKNSTPMYRVTHYYDMIPHMPQNLLGYLHIPQEVWYNEENNNYKSCNDYFNQEDNLCSNSCSPMHCTSINDHMNYLNIPMGSSDGLC